MGTTAAPGKAKILAPGVEAEGLDISDAGIPDASLVLGREERSVGVEEGADEIGASEQLVPLAGVEGHREAAKTVDGDAALVGDFAGQLAVGLSFEGCNDLVLFGNAGLEGVEFGLLVQVGENGHSVVSELGPFARNALATSPRSHVSGSSSSHDLVIAKSPHIPLIFP